MRDAGVMVIVAAAVAGAAYMLSKRGQAQQIASSLPPEIARYGAQMNPALWNQSGSADRVLTWV